MLCGSSVEDSTKRSQARFLVFDLRESNPSATISGAELRGPGEIEQVVVEVPRFGRHLRDQE